MKRDRPEEFGEAWHAGESLVEPAWDNLQVSHPELDRIVPKPWWARAGRGRGSPALAYGGSAVALCLRDKMEQVRSALETHWPVIEAEPGDGALAQCAQTS